MAARMSMLGQQFYRQLQAVPMQLVRYGIYAAVVIWLLLSIVSLGSTLLMTPDNSDIEQNVTVTPAQDKVQKAAGQVDVKSLQAINLFGVAGAKPAVRAPVEEKITINAEKTKLNLSLEGIVYSPDEAESVAVVVFQGKQDQYYIGDKLPGGSRVTLKKVLFDHVILDNAGRYESLWLYDKEKMAKQESKRQSVQPTRAIKPQVTDKRDDEDATSLAKDYRDKLYKNPKSLAQVIRISPAQKDGQMVGYRVSPGKDRKQFSQLGFKSNDIVTNINGIELDEPSKTLEIYKLMRTATQATFVVERNGSPVEVLVSLNESE